MLHLIIVRGWYHFIYDRIYHRDLSNGIDNREKGCRRDGEENP